MAVENSLQELAVGFSFCAMKKHAIALIALLISIFLIPLPGQAEPVCEGNNCTITFGYTGSMQTWQVPDGAINLSFEIYGASGARGGGGGGVTGDLVEVPDTLYIFVGGAGSQGVTAAGGYNGGGRAGGNRGNEGSGGGATDIRTGLELEDRILVAGGGGGGGGYSGASGAAGGGLIANSGASGQGGGGGGGTQVAGGGAGYSNGGSAASAGSFGQGGQGGTSWNAGGGGGGGGWYGGGGGGGDDDDCCADGGGGGGGSSYASATNTQNVEHQVGVNSGHGRLIITYSLAPVVIEFSGEQISAQTASFTLELSEAIVGLTHEDLAISTQSCQIASIATESQTANILLSGCADGAVSLTLRAFSIGLNDSGPTADAVATLDFDAVGPSFEWDEAPDAISTSAISLQFSVSDGVQPTTESFTVVGCSLAVSSSAAVLSSCSEGVVQLWLNALSLSDSWGNQSPQEPLSVSFVVDTQGPIASWSEVQLEGQGIFTYSAVLSFSESVSFSPALVSFSSEMDCELTNEQTAAGWLYRASCGYGSGSWTLSSSEVVDLLGNSGSHGSVSVMFDNPEPLAVPETEEQPQQQETAQSPAEPAPAAPAPAPVPVAPSPPAPEPVQPPIAESDETLPASESEEISTATQSPSVSAELEPELDQVAEEELAEELEREIAALPAPSTAPTPEPSAEIVAEAPQSTTSESDAATSNSEAQAESESQIIEVVETDEPAELLAEPALFENEPESGPNFPWQLALLAAAVLVGGALALRFSGR